MEHEGSPLVIVAGPGTGKTKTVVHRIARLVRGCGVSPRVITAIRFTKKAAGELHRGACAAGDAKGAADELVLKGNATSSGAISRIQKQG